MPGIEPGAFHMQSERSTTELHPLALLFVLWGVHKLEMCLELGDTFANQHCRHSVSYEHCLHHQTTASWSIPL